jgi:hypothetical protein
VSTSPSSPDIVPRASIAPTEVEAEVRAGASRAARASSSPMLAAAPDAALSLPWLAGAAGGAAPAAAWLVSPAAARPGGGSGYAQAVVASAKAAAKDRPAPAPKITGEWSFLTDASLSVEEKLARFMQAVQKKLDDELTRKMEDYRAKYGEGGPEAKKDDGGGIFGSILKAIFPPLAVADALFGGVDEFLVDALKSLAGPLLAALATAVGAPALAPAALKLGEGVVSMLDGGKPSTKPKTTPSKDKPATGKDKASNDKGAGAKGEAGSPDERLAMLEIQRLVDKQNQLFTLVSNVMKNVHDTSMVAVQNLR